MKTLQTSSKNNILPKSSENSPSKTPELQSSQNQFRSSNIKNMRENMKNEYKTLINSTSQSKFNSPKSAAQQKFFMTKESNQNMQKKLPEVDPQQIQLYLQQAEVQKKLYQMNQQQNMPKFPQVPIVGQYQYQSQQQQDLQNQIHGLQNNFRQMNQQQYNQNTNNSEQSGGKQLPSLQNQVLAQKKEKKIEDSKKLTSSQNDVHFSKHFKVKSYFKQLNAENDQYQNLLINPREFLAELKTEEEEMKKKDEGQDGEKEKLVIQGQIEGLYNFLMIPPELELAQNHMQAMCVKKPTKKEDINQQQIKNMKKDMKSIISMLKNLKEQNLDAKTEIHECPCCSYQIEREELPLCSPSIELQFLGSGYPLLFNYIQGCFSVNLIFLLIIGIYQIVQNLHGTFCRHATNQRSSCHNNIYNQMSMVNQYHNPQSEIQYYVEIVLLSISYVLLMIFMMFIRKQQRQLDSEINSQCTPADFTIMVRNIPQGLQIDYKQEIKKLFANFSYPFSYIEPIEVTLIYNMSFLKQLISELDQAIERKQQYLDDEGLEKIRHPWTLEYMDFNRNIQNILNRIILSIKYIQQDPQYFMGQAFVSFKTEKQKEQVLAENTYTFTEKWAFIKNDDKYEPEEPNHKNLMFNDSKLFLKQALEPKDINWDGIQERGINRIKGRLKSFGITFALALLSFSILLALNLFSEYVNKKAEEDHQITNLEEICVQAIQYSITIAIFGLNQFATGIIPDIISEEFQISNTHKTISNSNKLAVISFLNSAVIDFLICTVFTQNYYRKSGFITIQTTLALQSVFINPLTSLINTDYWQKEFEKKEASDDLEEDKCFMTQQQLNECFENTEFAIADVYADIINTMWITFLYAPLIPIITVCGLINLGLTYWVQKFTLMKRSSVKEVISIQSSIEMIENLEYIILLHATGHFIFEYQIFKTVNYLSIIYFSIGLVYTYLPMQEINEWFWDFDHAATEKTWIQATDEDIFEQTYEEENPINKFLKEMEHAKITLEEEDRIKYMKLNNIQSKEKKKEKTKEKE